MIRFNKKRPEQFWKLLQFHYTLIRKIKLAIWGLMLIAVAASACNYPGLVEQRPEISPLPPVSPFPTVTPVYRPSASPATATLLLPTGQPALEAPPAAEPTGAPPKENLLWLSPDLPEAFRSAVQLPPGWQLATEAEAAAVQVVIGSQNPVSQWVYALAAPFPTIPNNVSADDFLHTWQGAQSDYFAGAPLMMNDDTYRAIAAWLGEPPDNIVQITAQDKLLNNAWKNRPAWAVIPFEQLEPRWKVLHLSGESPVRNIFNPSNYALTLPISLIGDETAAADFQAAAKAAGMPAFPASNRDPAKMTVVAMTGVTALVRATAYTMEQRGIKYPAQDVSAILKSADITHISNEVPFAENCPFPNPVQQSMKFCSDPRYIKLLEFVGTDVVELTGDHFQDWGGKAMRYTLSLYKQRGWQYYGGGENNRDAKQPALIEHNGNRIAFIGCNAKGSPFAQAGKKSPGAISCKGDWMPAIIKKLRADGYLPIVTFQHFEYYTYQAQPNQKRDFRKAAQSGAVVVSGSQAHQPQSMEFANGALIHYGLGNLFFDQYDVSAATRQAFIDLHVFYDGRYISTELIPILFVDYARPRPMTQKESKRLLKAVFSASNW